VGLTGGSDTENSAMLKHDLNEDARERFQLPAGKAREIIERTNCH
jgi:hypothetical protein